MVATKYTAKTFLGLGAVKKSSCTTSHSSANNGALIKITIIILMDGKKKDLFLWS